MTRITRILALLVALFASQAAQAALTCSISAPAMDFGTLTTVPFPQTDTTPNLSINCTGGSAGATVRICVGITPGTWVGTASPQRFMSSGTDNIEFQIYSDASHSTVWGGVLPLFAGGMQEPLPAIVLGSAGNGSANYPMYGRILNPPAQTEVPGTYTSSLQFTGKFPSGGSPCSGGSGSSTLFSSGSFQAQVAVASSCSVVAADIDFGATATCA